MNADIKIRKLAWIAVFVFSANILVTHVVLQFADVRGMEYHDFYPVLAASRILRKGEDPYKPKAVAEEIQTFRVAPPVASAYLYPTFLAHAVTPLSALPVRIAQRVWHLANIACVAAIAFLGIRLFVQPERRLYAWVFLLGLFSFFEPIWRTVSIGQANAIVVLTIMLGLYAAVRKRPRLAGVALGVGAMVKFWPLVILYYFLLRRNWAVLKSAAITISLILLVSFILSPAGVQSSYYTEHLPRILDKGGPTTTPTIHNVNVLGLATRTFTDTIADTVSHRAPHVLALDVGVVTWIVRLVGIVSLAAVSFITFRRRGEEKETPGRLVADASLYLLLLVLFSSFIPTHYLIVLMIPFMGIFLSSEIRNVLIQKRALWIGTAFAFIFSGFFITESYYRIWHNVPFGSFMIQPRVYGLFLLFGVLMFLSLQLRRETLTSQHRKRPGVLRIPV